MTRRYPLHCFCLCGSHRQPPPGAQGAGGAGAAGGRGAARRHQPLLATGRLRRLQGSVQAGDVYWCHTVTVIVTHRHQPSLTTGSLRRLPGSVAGASHSHSGASVCARVLIRPLCLMSWWWSWSVGVALQIKSEIYQYRSRTGEYSSRIQVSGMMGGSWLALFSSLELLQRKRAW